jgi:CRISPR/Cas system-associated exonuclease Cas4 (RecB family)
MQSLSYSSLSKFDECPERLYREYFVMERGEGIVTPKNARGTIIHEFLDQLMKTKIATKDWPLEAESVEAMRTMWNDSQGMTTWADEDRKEGEDFYGRSAEDSLHLVHLLYRDILSYLNPIESEQTIYMDLPQPGKTITKLMGKVDLVAEPNFVIDWKTSSSEKKWLDYDLQATVYAALLGLEFTIVQFIQFIFLKGKKPRIVVGYTKRDQRHVDFLLNVKIPRVIETIEKQLFVPKPGWACSNCPMPCGAVPDLEVVIGKSDSKSNLQRL